MKDTVAALRTPVFGLVVGGCLAAGIATQSKNASFDGLIRQLAEPEKAATAADSLQRAGRSCVPALLRTIGDAESPSRIGALRVLGRLGPEAGEVVDELIEAVDVAAAIEESDMPLNVFLPMVETLSTLIAYSPKYATAAANRRGDVPQALSDQLSRLGCKEEAKGDDAPRMRRAQVRCELRSMFVLLPDSPIDELRDGLAHRSAPVRELAAELLARRAGEAAAAAPALAACLRSRHEDARFGELFIDAIHANAATALLALDAEAAAATPAHAWAVRNAAEPQRYQSAAFLARQGTGAAEAVPALVAALEDVSPRVVREAITALGAVGPAAKRATAALQSKATSSDRQIAERARAALRSIRGEAGGGRDAPLSRDSRQAVHARGWVARR